MNKDLELKIPLYLQIAKNIEGIIADKCLPAGTKLPSVRFISSNYGVSTCTVHKALEELKYKGIIESKAGSAYFVSYDGWNTLFPDTPDWDKYLKQGWFLEQNISSSIHFDSHLISLHGFWAGAHFGATKYLQKAMSICASKETLFTGAGGSDNLGLLSLREEISRHIVNYGVIATPDEICITSGIFNALNLMRMAFMRPGIDFICENTFTQKLNSSYLSLGIEKVLIPVDNEGMKLNNLKQALIKGKQAVVCTTFGGIAPYADNVTFGITPMERKKAVLKMCNTSRTPIIEIDNFRDLYPNNAALPLKSVDNTNSVLYTGSLTKSFMQKWRIGWVVGPKNVIKKLANLKMQMEGSQNFVTQEITAELFKNGLYNQYLDQMGIKMKEYMPQIESIFEKHLSCIATYNLNAITRGINIKFNEEVNVRKMYKNRGNLQFLPGYMLDPEWEQGLRISAITLHPTDLEEAIKQLVILAKNCLS